MRVPLRSPVRVATLFLCFGLSACISTSSTSEAPPFAPVASPAAAAASTAPTGRSPGSAGGARGGGVTAAARGEPVEAPADPVMQARADCWMKVESQKALRGIDQRVAYVDKCVAEQVRGKP